jgi:hypothetical protein
MTWLDILAEITGFRAGLLNSRWKSDSHGSDVAEDGAAVIMRGGLARHYLISSKCIEGEIQR